MTPAQRIDTDAIVDAALALIDREGAQSLTMRTLADRLEVKAASLYYHVPNRARLLQLIAERVATSALAAVEPGLTWRQLGQSLAGSLRASLRQHPGATQIVAVQEVSAETYLPIVPAVLAAFAGGLTISDDDALMLIQSLYLLVVGLALAESGNVPEPPAAPIAYYDAWFDLAVGTFLDGIEARYAR